MSAYQDDHMGRNSPPGATTRLSLLRKAGDLSLNGPPALSVPFAVRVHDNVRGKIVADFYDAQEVVHWALGASQFTGGMELAGVEALFEPGRNFGKWEQHKCGPFTLTRVR